MASKPSAPLPLIPSWLAAPSPKRPAPVEHLSPSSRACQSCPARLHRRFPNDNPEIHHSALGTISQASPAIPYAPRRVWPRKSHAPPPTIRRRLLGIPLALDCRDVCGPSGRLEMIFFVTTIAIATVAFFWVKTRSQRKDEAARRTVEAASRIERAA